MEKPRAIKSAPMRTVSLALQLALILFVRSTLAADNDPRNISGWDKTVWGMSEDEVLAAEAPRGAERVVPKNETGDIGTIVIKNLEITGKQFSATFSFDSKNRKLKYVGLMSATDVGGDIGIIFSRIEKLLTETYGEPTFNKTGEDVLWKLPKTTIELLRFDTPPASLRQIVISYRPTQVSADESKNL